MPKPSSILFLVTQSDLGGAQRYVLALAKTAQEQGRRVIIAAGPDGDQTLFQACKHLGLTSEIIPHLRRKINFRDDQHALSEIRAICERFTPDVVHANSSKAGVLASFAIPRVRPQPKLVYTAHGWSFLEPLSLYKRLAYGLSEFLAGPKRDATIVLSQQEATIVKRYHLAKPNTLHIIPNGVTTIPHDRTRAQSTLRQLGVPSTTTLIGCVANFYPAKNIPALVHTFQHATRNDPSYQLVLIGDGPEHSLVTHAKGEDPRIHLLGYRPDARELMDGFDLFVLPSLKEGLPFALLEAMEASLPCLATSVGGIPEVISHGVDGWLAAPTQIETGLLQALISRETWDMLGRAAQNKIHTRFSQTQMIQNTFDVYENLFNRT